MKCKTCHWWKYEHGNQTPEDQRWRNLAWRGMCGRHAPVVIEGIQRGEGRTIWPMTAPDDFCGDHQDERM